MLCRRRQTFNWYIYITRNQFVLPSNIKANVEYQEIPLLFILVQSNDQIDKEILTSIESNSSNWIPKSKIDGIRQLVIPESWL